MLPLGSWPAEARRWTEGVNLNLCYNIHMIRVYTDGSSRGNPGKGGWGFMIEGGAERGGFETETTNNKMELQAVIEAFKYLINQKTADETIEIYTDSEYVIKGLTIWIDGWIKRDWMTAAKKPVLNQDYWKELSNLKYTLKQMKNTVHMRYVPGHAGIAGNERVDTIATTCAIEQRGHRQN